MNRKDLITIKQILEGELRESTTSEGEKFKLVLFYSKSNTETFSTRLCYPLIYFRILIAWWTFLRNIRTKNINKINFHPSLLTNKNLVWRKGSSIFNNTPNILIIPIRKTINSTPRQQKCLLRNEICYVIRYITEFGIC